MKNVIISIFIYLSIFFISSLFSQTISLTKTSEKINLNTNLFYFEDKQQLSIESIPQQSFIPYNHNSIKIPFSKSSFWFHFKLINYTDNKEWFLVTSSPTIDQIFLYTKEDDQQFSLQKEGRLIPFSKKIIEYRHHIFKISISPKESKHFYIQIKNEGQRNFIMHLESSVSFYKNESRVNGYLGLYYGFLLMTILFTVFLSFFIRWGDHIYKYYLFYLISYFLLQVTLDGFGYQYLWSNSVLWNKYSYPIAINLLVTSTLLFSLKFLQFGKYYYELNKVCTVLMYIFILLIPLCFIHYTLSIKMGLFLGLFTSSFAMLSAIYCFFKGEKAARYFIIAWSVYLTGVFSKIMMSIGLFPYNFFTKYGMQIGSILEMMLLSVALADRFNIIKEKNIVLNQELDDLNKNLQKIVEKRTKKLEKAQDYIVQSEKMLALGRATTRIVHELNNPIYISRCSIETLQNLSNELITQIDQSTEPKHFKKFLKDFKNRFKSMSDASIFGINRVSELIKNFKSISSSQEKGEESEFYLLDYIQQSIFSMESILRKNQIIVKVIGDNPLISEDASIFYQITQNMITNSIKYAYPNKEGGLIDIVIEDNPDYIELNYIDYGKGISKENQSKIFDLFFTTAGGKDGIGIGLNVVYQRITNHLKGKIECKSELGKGTTFIIQFPKSINQGKL